MRAARRSWVLALLLQAFVLSGCDRTAQDRLPEGLGNSEGNADAANMDSFTPTEEEPGYNDSMVVPEPTPPTTAAPVLNEVADNEPVDELAPEPSPRFERTSFSCDGDLNRVEQWVCTNPDLAAMDRTLAANAVRAARDADPARATILRQSGRVFLANRDRCPDPSCVAQAYRWRMREIAEIMDRNAL